MQQSLSAIACDFVLRVSCFLEPLSSSYMLTLEMDIADLLLLATLPVTHAQLA